MQLVNINSIFLNFTEAYDKNISEKKFLKFKLIWQVSIIFLSEIEKLFIDLNLGFPKIFIRKWM